MEIASRSRSKLKQEAEVKQQEAWQKLPVEIIQDLIFMKLPEGNSILSSRCVCKRFNILLSQPYFIKKHVNLSIQINKTNPRLLFSHYVSYHEPPTIHSVPIDYASISSPQGCEGALLLNYPFKSKDERCDHRFLGSCNGLIWFNICRVERVDNTKEYEVTNYFSILNPLTREFKEFRMQTVRKYAFGVAYGFGYDDSIDDYKVVAISDNKTTGFSRFEIYTVRLGSLRTIQGTERYTFRDGIKHGCRGMFFNGRLHWVGCIATQKNPSRAILCYDISNERMMSMPLPEEIRRRKDSTKSCCRTMGVCGDCISVTVIWDNRRVDVWVMQEYGVNESWVKKFAAIQLQPLRKLECWRPLWWFENGEVLVDCGFRQNLQLFDLTTREVRSVVVRDIAMDGRRESYVESIASLNSGTYLETQQSTYGL